MIYEKISGFSDEISSDISTQFNTLNRLGINFFEPRGVDVKNISLLNDDEVQTLLKKMNKFHIGFNKKTMKWDKTDNLLKLDLSQ